MRNKKRIYLIAAMTALMLVVFHGLSEAQQNNLAYGAYSPYSLFGLGIIEKTGTENTLSMGGMGIADRNNAIINVLNPAAVTAREKKSFMLDFGLIQKNVYYSAKAMSIDTNKDKILSSANNIFNIHHIVASFPIYGNTAFKLGIMPYSSTGYNFISTEDDDKIISEIGEIKYEKKGQGGIYQSFIGVGTTFFDRLSIGADFLYYLGTIDRSSSVYFLSGGAYRTIKTGWEFVSRGASAKFGLQYVQPLNQNIDMTFGATYKLSSKLGGDVTKYAFGKTSSVTDTIVFNKDNIKGYDIPQEIGIGFTIRKKDKWMIGADYLRQDWTDTDFGKTPGVEFKTCIAQSFNAGFEYIPNKYDIRYYMKRVTYRGGIYYNKTYMSLNGHQIDNMGITFGISLPVFYRNTSVSLGVDIGQSGTRANNLIRERYFKFTMGLNLFDIWFQKPMYN